MRLILCLFVMLLQGPLSASEAPRSLLLRAFAITESPLPGRFDYDLRIVDGRGQVRRDARYFLLPQSGQLLVEDRQTDELHWWDGQRGWRYEAKGQWRPLAESAAARLAGHVSSHFLALIADPQTRIEALPEQRLRLHPREGEAFTVQLDPQTGRIVENHFDDGTRVLELDYQDLGGFDWPMLFEVQRADGERLSGRFSNVAWRASTELPQKNLPKFQVGRD